MQEATSPLFLAVRPGSKWFVESVFRSMIYQEARRHEACVAWALSAKGPTRSMLSFRKWARQMKQFKFFFLGFLAPPLPPPLLQLHSWHAYLIFCVRSTTQGTQWTWDDAAGLSPRGMCGVRKWLWHGTATGGGGGGTK